MNKSKPRASKKAICATIVILILSTVLLLTLGQSGLPKVFAVGGTYVYTKFGNYNITEDNIKADCSNMTTMLGKVFKIAKNVDCITFIGNPNQIIDNFRIFIEYRDRPFQLNLVDMKIRGLVDEFTICIAGTSETTIAYSGDCIIEGGARTSPLEPGETGAHYLHSSAIFNFAGITRIQRLNVGTLTVHGGQGRNGLRGGNAFFGNYINIYDACTFIGGHGGDGEDGAAGVNGGVGGNGTVGGNGGSAIEAVKLQVHTTQLTIRGGNGGTGGRGGKGGNGHNGTNGAFLVFPTAGTNGGEGGSGGNGGKGGKFFGGLIYNPNYQGVQRARMLDYGNPFTFADGKSVGGVGGNGGNGGNGSKSMKGKTKFNQGSGGNGGAGGWSVDYFNFTYDRSAYGAKGADGNP